MKKGLLSNFQVIWKIGPGGKPCLSLLILNLVLTWAVIDMGVAGIYEQFTRSVEHIHHTGALPIETDVPQGSAVKKRSYYYIVSRRDLFKTEVAAAPKKLSVPAPAKPGTALPDLTLDLMGTITGSGLNPKAVIKKQKQSTQKIYQEGDLIGPARVETILRGKVILMVNGTRRTLVLRKQNMASTPAFATSGAALSVALPRHIPADLREGFTDTVQLTWDQVKRLKAEAVNFRKTLNIRPHFSKNQLDGFRVYGIGDGSVFGRMGLKNGDIISSVNQREIRSEADAAEIYTKFASLSGSTMMNLGIRRKGQSGTIRYEIE